VAHGLWLNECDNRLKDLKSIKKLHSSLSYYSICLGEICLESMCCTHLMPLINKN
jgi:hypothetical protein